MRAATAAGLDQQMGVGSPRQRQARKPNKVKGHPRRSSSKPTRKSASSQGKPRVDLSRYFEIEYADLAEYGDGEYELDELKSVFSAALNTLGESDSFVQMMRETGRQPFTVIFDDTMEEYGAIDPDDRVIYLSSHAPPEQIIATLAHEIRHAHQYKNAMGTAQVDRLKKRDFIVWNLLIEADAASTEAQVLAEIGHTPLGKKAKQHSADMPYYGPVHSAFNRVAAKDPKAVSDGRAQLAAFKRYFRTKLVDIYKTGFTEYYRELRADGVMADKHIPDHAAKALGWHRTGGNYLDQDAKLANRTGTSLRRNPAFFGRTKRKRKGRNQQLIDPRRVCITERCDAMDLPRFAQPQRPQGHEGPALRPF
ncbi:MAG: DUF6782 family putative metallopeptidase [Pseudomonadota bacterium]